MRPDDECLRVLNELDGWFEPAVLIREYSVRLTEIPSVALGIRIYYDADRERDPYRFDLSHLAATPTQAGPYLPSGPWRASEAGALRAGLEAVTKWVKIAVREGHAPSERWLRPSSSWARAGEG